MEVAFAGAGGVARRYAADLATDAGLRLVAVADRERNRAEALVADTDGVPFGSVETMLRTAEPDLVANLTSHGAHASVTRTCLGAGVPVFSEKPLALDGAVARALVDLAETNGVGLDCAPVNHRGDHQRLAARRLADGTVGPVRVVQATANVGRVTEWHDRPDSFLEAGPLYDGAVYPLTLLLEWFGPATRVRTADATSPYPARAGVDPGGPTHVEGTLELRGGPFVRLSASFYVPHTAREFYGVELHGDDASLYLADAGELGGGRDPLVAVGRAGREYTGVPLQRPPSALPMTAGISALAEAVRAGGAPTRGARRGAHVVAICEAIERAAESGGPVSIDDCGFSAGGPPSVAARPPSPERRGRGGPGSRAAVRLPPVGFGCARYRDGDYVDRRASIAAALDAGYRLLDSAELYGNESRIGEVLGDPGSPDREALVLVSKVWNTNHGHVREACEGTIAALGVDSLDAYLLHWPESWRYTGPLRDLASLPVAEQEARTFPTDGDGEPVPGDVSLETAWRKLEAVRDAGLARTIGVCNVDRETLAEILEFAAVPPAVVQVERHPYQPRDALVDFCHDRGVRVMAHSPLSAPGLRSEPVLVDIADAHGVTPAQVVLAWNVGRGVVPVPSSLDPAHIEENAAAAGLRLDPEDRERIAGLADPGFER